MAAMLGRADSAGLGSLASSVLGGKTNGALYVDLLHSRTVQDRIVERFELQKEYWKRYRGDAIKKLDSLTTVEEDRKSGIITISVSDGDRDRARQMAGAYVDELNRLLADVSTSAARRERVFVEQRLATVRKDLSSSEKAFSEFASKNAMLDVTEQAKAMVESAAMLQGQLIAAESELQGLRQIYTPENVRVRSANARVEELRRQLRGIGGASSGEKLAEPTAGSDLYPSIRQLPLLGVTWVDLYRRAKIQETLFELLTKQYELARIQEAKEIPTIKVVDPANWPERKSFPPRLMIIFLFALAGVAAASGWILLSPRWQELPSGDPRKRIVGEMTQQLASGWQRQKLLQRFKGERSAERSNEE